MSPVFEVKKEISAESFLQHASYAMALIGVLAFWAGMLMAGQRYPSEYDWRYMPVSNLLSPSRNPTGYLWASVGTVLYSLCGLFWVGMLAQRRKHDGMAVRLSGIMALQFANFCMLIAVLLSRWLHRIHKGHEILAVLAFAGLLIGMIRMMFQTIVRTLLRRMSRFSGHARLYAAILASAAVFPIVLAGLIQTYVRFVLPDLPWVNLSWRARGVPAYLSFAFWEWVTCVVLSAYMVILSVATREVHPRT